MLHAQGKVVGLVTALFSMAAFAAGADGSWSWCSQPSRLKPDPAGRSLYVATWGSDPSGWCPGSGYTFRTIAAAARCARGKDTIFVKGGNYGRVQISNLWPSDRVLITNASGENPVIDGWGSVADYSAVFGLWQTSNFAIQGLIIQNTGVPDAEHGGYGIKVSASSSIKIYYNTVKNTARHGIMTQGSQMEVVGNEVSNAVMRNQWFRSDYWDAAISSDPTQKQWGYKAIGNSIHDSYGECMDVLTVDGATVQGNKIYNCVSTNVFVSNSQNVTVDRNWLYQSDTKYNRPDYGYRATGIQLANEGHTTGWSLKNVRISNNIIEWVSQGIRYWRSHSGSSVADTYGSLYVGFNDINRTQFSPIRLDTPEWGWPSSNSRMRQNLVINTSSNSWFSSDQQGAWNVANNRTYAWNTTSTNPGINDTWGTYVHAYEWKSSSSIRRSVAPWSEWDMPSTDYHCQLRDQNAWNSPGAIN